MFVFGAITLQLHGFGAEAEVEFREALEETPELNVGSYQLCL